MHRCFYALRFESSTIEYLERIVGDLRSHGADVAWVRPGNLHLTLRFLGEITDEQLQRALRAPEDASRRTHGPIQLRAEGLGAFPGLRNAKVIWAGISAGSAQERAQIEATQSLTEGWARAIGIPPDDKRYRPHVTLGRVRRPGPKLRELVDDVTTRECVSPVSTIGELVLIRSTLSSEGSVYEDIGRWRL